jgi:hypothetical protein
MDYDPTGPLVAPLFPEGDPSTPRIVTCPMCNTAHPSLTRAAVVAGEDWRCSRCGQQWDADRLAAVAAYAAWMRDREPVFAAAARSAPHLRILQGGKQRGSVVQQSIPQHDAEERIADLQGFGTRTAPDIPQLSRCPDRPAGLRRRETKFSDDLPAVRKANPDARPPK